MKQRLFQFLAIVAVALSGLTITGCSNTDTPTMDKGSVRVIHVSPNARAVDFYVDDLKKYVPALGFAQASSYVDAAVGERKIRINLAGTDSALLRATVEVSKDKHYSVFAGNFAEDLTPYVYVDDMRVPGVGYATVRMIHLVPGAPLVDIYVDGALAVPHLGFTEATNFLPIVAGAHAINVKLAGSNTTVIDIPAFTFDSQKIYTIYANMQVSSEGAQTIGAAFYTHN